MSGKYIHGKSSWIKHIDFIFLNLLSLPAGFALAYSFKFHNIGFLYSTEWKIFLVIAILTDCVVILFSNPFSGIFRRNGLEELSQTAKQILAEFLFVTIILFTLKIGGVYSRVTIIATYVIYFLLTYVLRILWKRLAMVGKMPVSGATKSIFIVADRANIEMLLRNLNTGLLHEYNIQGICIADGEPGERISVLLEDFRLFGSSGEKRVSFQSVVSLSDVPEFILRNRIDELLVGITPLEIPAAAYQLLIDNGKVIHLCMRSLIGFDTEDQFITTVGTNKAIGLGMYAFTGWQLVYLSAKRGLDILCGLIGCAALLPLGVIVKISFLLTGDYHSIFYSQKRIGLNGKPFTLLKFRSMVQDADQLLADLLTDPMYRREWERSQKLENDPRITKMGKFLRKTSLDEMPQLLNVLKGDMSLIGPRPLVPGELEEHHGLQLYNQVKPGLTGWWACNGRFNRNYDERLQLEYFYVKNCSPYLDILCLVKTIKAVLMRDGAV